MAPRKVVIDTDPGVDDVLAILLALASPEVDVALITLVFGNTHAPQTFANLLKLYYNLGIELKNHPEARERYAGVAAGRKTRVAIGEDYPIGGTKHVATYFHGKDGLSNISDTNPEFTPPANDTTKDTFLEVTDERAYKAILDLLRAEPENSVTIIALGPLTNVAWAYREDPATFSRVAEVVWMGGALDVPGNTSPVAEFNCFADPYAFAALVEDMQSDRSFQFTFAPLDITTPHSIAFTDLLHPALIPGADTAAAKQLHGEPTQLESFVTSFLLRVRGLQAKFGNPDAMEMHDPVAVWYAVANAAQDRTPTTAAAALEEGWGTAPRAFGIERCGEVTRGMCVVDRRGTGEATTDRTQDTELTGDGITGREVVSADKAKETGEGKIAGASAAAEEFGETKALPHVISRTPGSEALRRLLLGRVFGKQVV